MSENNTLLAKLDAMKSRLGSLRPLPKEALEKIREALDIEYTYESHRIEGNTLTLQETALVVVFVVYLCLIFIVFLLDFIRVILIF